MRHVKVIYGSNPELADYTPQQRDFARQKAASDRTKLDAGLATALKKGNRVEAARIEAQKAHYGQFVDIATLVGLEGTNGNKWQIKPTCPKCSEHVYLQNYFSLERATRLNHRAARQSPLGAQKCSFRFDSAPQWERHSEAPYDHKRAQENRARFFTPDNVMKAAQVLKEILGPAYRQETLPQLIRHADAEKIWDKSRQPELVPFQLLLLDEFEYHYPRGQHKGQKFRIRFMKEQKSDGAPPRIFAFYADGDGKIGNRRREIPGFNPQKHAARAMTLFNSGEKFGYDDGCAYICATSHAADFLAPHPYQKFREILNRFGDRLDRNLRAMIHQAEAVVADYGTAPPQRGFAPRPPSKPTSPQAA
ncbi:MAG: hypothetical protein WBK91_00485 [Alphaproteobacteria bacterium]